MFGFTREGLIQFLRKRAEWTQAELAKQSELEWRDIHRYENLKRSPRDEQFKQIMDTFGLPTDTFFCPYLDVFDTGIFALKDQILYELHWGAHYPDRLKKAETLLMELMKADSFDSGINRQFILSCMARLYELQGKPPGEILDITQEGLSITYPDFDPGDFAGDILLFAEPELIQSQALALHKKGSTGKAIALLQRTKEGLDKLPQDSRSKETLLAPILLNLSRLLLASNDYNKALEVCNEGFTLSNKRNRGMYTPDFAFLKAKILSPDKPKECGELLAGACGSFSLMRKQNMAKEVKEYAKSLGFKFETYGMEDEPVQVPDLTVAYGDNISCKNLGEFFKGLRFAADLDIKEACKGICSESTLYKLENYSTSTDIFTQEALLQRYGRFASKYFAVFMSVKDHNVLQLRNEVNLSLAQGKYADMKEKKDSESEPKVIPGAETLVSELGKISIFKKNMNLQYVQSVEAEIYRDKNRYDDKHLEMLLKAWHTTQGKFDVDKIPMTRLTYGEIVTLNQIGLNYCGTGERRKGVKVFENLCTSMNRYYVDEMERMRMYPTVLANRVKHIGILGDRNYALELAKEGDEMCVKHGNLDTLSRFAIARAYNMLELSTEKEEKEKSIPIFAQAYHASKVVGEANNQENVRRHVKERFNIDLGAEFS